MSMGYGSMDFIEEDGKLIPLCCKKEMNISHERSHEWVCGSCGLKYRSISLLQYYTEKLALLDQKLANAKNPLEKSQCRFELESLYCFKKCCAKLEKSGIDLEKRYFEEWVHKDGTVESHDPTSFLGLT